MFMNEWEVDQAAERYQKHPILGRATWLLKEFKNLVNSSSDGWPYWTAAQRAADKLVDLVQGGPEKATEGALKAATTVLKGFCTRHKLKFPEKGTTRVFRGEFYVTVDANEGNTDLESIGQLRDYLTAAVRLDIDFEDEGNPFGVMGMAVEYDGLTELSQVEIDQLN